MGEEHVSWCMKRVAWLVLLVPMLVGCGDRGPGGTTTLRHEQIGGASASCVGPYLDDQPPDGRFGAPTPTVTAGDTLTIHGHFYTETCNDTGGDDPLVPMAPVRLMVALPGGHQLDLGTFTPGGRDMGFSVDVGVPVSTPEGRALVRDDLGHRYAFEVS